MLIPSPRHKPEDLELWAELEAADAIHGKRPALRRRFERSLESVLAFAAQGPCYASVSWGKDSVVLAHLVAVAELPVPLVHLRVTPTENPHTSDVRDAFLGRYPNVEYVELVKESRHLYASPAERMAAKKLSFAQPFRDAGFGGWRYLSGVRASESGARKIRMRIWGECSRETCAPLGWWTNADVFGYLAATGLPAHPNYAMLGGGRWSRDRLRVSELAGEFGREWGRLEWEQEYYGDILRELQARQRAVPK